LKHEDRPVNLDALLGQIQLQVDFVVTNHRPKLRFIIVNVVISPLLTDPSVVARYRGTLHSNLAFRPASHPDTLLRNVFNADQSRTLQIDLFQYEMLPFGHLYRHQLMNLCLFLNKFGVLILTDLAEELVEVIVGQTFHLVLFHFRLVPFLQTTEVHQRTGTRTFARTAQKLALLLPVLQHAVLAFTHRLPRTHRYMLMAVDDSVNQN
jgi:hypothetical protein